MAFVLKFEGEDSRGKVWSFKIGDIEYILFFTKAGCMRGGDYHSKRQFNSILQGTVRIILKTQTLGDIPMVINEGQSMTVPPNVPHYMKSLDDSWVLEWHELPKTRTIYEPYRKIIMESLENAKKT